MKDILYLKDIYTYLNREERYDDMIDHGISVYTTQAVVKLKP